MVHRVRFTKFIESESYRHRLQMYDSLTFVPFPGMILTGYTETPVLDLTVEKVCWNKREHLFDCILESKESEWTKKELQEMYGSDWKLDGVHLTLEGLKSQNDELWRKYGNGQNGIGEGWDG